MIYQATHHVNFAQGEMAMFSTYIAWTLIDAGLPYWVAFFADAALRLRRSASLIERVLMRPMDAGAGAVGRSASSSGCW